MFVPLRPTGRKLATGGTLIFRIEGHRRRARPGRKLQPDPRTPALAGYRLGRGHRWVALTARTASPSVPPSTRMLPPSCSKPATPTSPFSTLRKSRAQPAAGRPAEFGYDGYDRNLTDEQKAAFRAEGRKPALRIKMPDEDIAFDDLDSRHHRVPRPAPVPDYVIVRPERRPTVHADQPGRRRDDGSQRRAGGEDPPELHPAPDRALPLPLWNSASLARCCRSATCRT